MKRRALLVTLLVLTLLPAWVLGTASGLRFALRVTGWTSGAAISVKEVHGRLVGDVRLVGLSVTAPAATVTFAQVEANLRLTRLLIGRVQAERLAVHELAVIVHARPSSPERKPLRVRAPLRLAVEDGQVTDFRLRLASGREWTLPEAQFAGRWRAEWIVLARLRAATREVGPVQMRGRLSIADDLLQFEDFEVTQPSPVRVEGVLALTAQEESVLRLSWERLRWPDSGEAGARLSWLESPRGTLEVEGPWQRYAWKLEAGADAAGVPAEVTARGHGDLASLALDSARANALGGTARGSGTVAWSPALSTDFELRWENLDPAARFAGWPGRLNGTATLQARWDQRQPEVAFDGRFEASQLRGYPFLLQARGGSERESVVLHELAAQSGDSELRASGGLWPRLGLKGSLRSGDFGSLWAGLAGQGEAQFTAQGEPESARVTLRAGAQALAFRGYRAGRATLDASVARAGRSDLSLRLEQVNAGIALDTLTLTGAGTEAAHRLALEARGAEGRATLALDGAVRGAQWRGQLVDATLAPPGEAPFTLEEPAAFAWRRGALRLEPACLRGPDSRACADLDLAAGAQRIAFRIHQFALARLRPWLPPDWAVSGELSGTAALQLRGGELSALRADLAGTAGAIDGDGVRLEYGPGTLRVQPGEGGRLDAALDLTPAGGRVHGEVSIAPGAALLDRPMRGALGLQLPDLAWLPVLSPEIAAAQGSIDADFRVSGTPRSPSLEGHLQVAGGRVRLATPGIELTDIAASFDSGPDAPLRAHLSAKSGDGHFTLEGVLRALQPRPAGEFTLKGEDVLGVNTAEMRAWITPDLRLALDGRNARFTGELRVPRAEITPRRIRGGGVAPSSDQVVASGGPEAPDRGLQVESQVRVVLGDKVRFEGLGLRTRLEGALTAADEPGRPTTGRGELRLVGGRYKAYGQDLQIETGRLLFNGGPITDPAIELSAYRELPANPQMTRVGLRARGTLEAPEFSLYSDSATAISQEEQLSWLVLGRSLTTTETTATQADQLDEARTSIGLAGGDLLAQQLAPRLGLDEVSVGARPGETADLARLTIGKYLSPKLFLSYGVGLFQPGHFFRLQYDLSRRFKLQGESGLNQGGDLLYTIESGGKKKE